MPSPAAGAAPFFTADHRECDEAFSALEQAVDAGDSAKALSAWTAFRERMDRHLRMEEEVLFPAFEAATGMHGGGPTQMMRHEHQQMRALLAEMASRATAGDLDGLLDQGDTLLMLIQQHNAKEETILYPMASRALGGEWPQVAAKLQSYL